MTKRTAALVLILLLALAGRVLFCAKIVGWSAPLRGDEVDYHAIACSIVDGRGFANDRGEATAARPPVYPLALAAVYALAGERPEAGRAFQVALGVLAVALVYALARALIPERPWAAFVAAALAAVSPQLVFISSYLLAENLYIVVALLFLLAFARGPAGERRPRRLLAAGVLLGIGSLTRPNLFPFALVVLAAMLLPGGGPLRSRAVRAALVALGIAVSIAPWAIRNGRVIGGPVLFTTHGGITFYQGNNEVALAEPRYRGGVAPLDALPGWRSILERGGEIERDREAWRLGKEFVRENADAIPRMSVWKFVRFWRFTGEMGMSGVRSGWWWDKGRMLGRLASSFDAVLAYSIASIPLFALGMLLTIRDRRFLLPLLLVLAHTAMAVVFYGSLRSRVPIEPVIAVYAAAALARLPSALRRREATPPFAG